MLDRAHAAGDGAADSDIAVDMRHDIAPGARRLVGDGGDLFQRILRMDELVARRGDAAAGHDLDMVAALADVLAHRLAHLVDTVGDDADTAERLAAIAEFGAAAMVAMAAGLRQDASGDEHARPFEEPLFLRRPVALVGAAGIADRREAAMQHAGEMQSGARRHLGGQHRAAVVEGADIDMRMAVDQARREIAPAKIDALQAGIERRLVRDRDDLAAPDDDRLAGHDRAGDDVDDVDAGQGIARQAVGILLIRTWHRFPPSRARWVRPTDRHTHSRYRSAPRPRCARPDRPSRSRRRCN